MNSGLSPMISWFPLGLQNFLSLRSCEIDLFHDLVMALVLFILLFTVLALGGAFLFSGVYKNLEEQQRIETL